MNERSSLTDHIEPGFNAAARKEQKPKKRSSPVSIRFSDEQRASLERHADGQALGPYIKSYVLRNHGVGLKSNNRNSAKDYELLAQLLRGLGQSEIRTYLCALHELANEGRFVTDKDTVALLRKACADIASMRKDLVSALGLRERRSE